MRNGELLFAGFRLNVFGKVFQADDSVFRKNDGMLDDVLEFTDVARVRVTRQGVLRGGFQIQDVLAVGFLVLEYKVTDERRDYGLAFAQGRQLQVERVQAVVEVFAESPHVHRLLQVAVCRGDNAYVQVARLGLADAPDFVILQKAQKLDLRRCRQFADFVQEQRTAVRGFEKPFLVGGGAGVRALLGTEEFAFYEIFGNGAAVHCHERFAGALAKAVHHVREEFLAGTGFAGNEHRACGRCNLVDGLENLAHLGRVAQKAVEHLRFHQLVRVLGLLLRLDFLGGAFELAYGDGLHQEAVRPAANGSGRSRPVLGVAEDENLDTRILFLEVAHHVHVFERQERDLDKGEVYGIVLDQGHQGFPVITRQQLRVGQGPGLLDVADKGFIQIGDQDFHRGSLN